MKTTDYSTALMDAFDLAENTGRPAYLCHKDPGATNPACWVSQTPDADAMVKVLPNGDTLYKYHNIVTG